MLVEFQSGRNISFPHTQLFYICFFFLARIMQSQGNKTKAKEKYGVIYTILIEASARLMKVGATSPSGPAASSAAESHNERTVPIN